MNASRTPELPDVPASVVHLLRDASHAYPERYALAFDGTRLTYAQYTGLVGALAKRLSTRVGSGKRVALVMQNSLDLAVATFAVHALRAQVVPLNPGYSTCELAAMLDDAAPAMVLYDASVKADIDALLPALQRDAKWCTGDGLGLLTLLPEACELPADLPCHDDLATLQYTGGTTGRAKGVNILHRQLAWNLAQREAWLPTRRGEEIVLCVMPLFHVSAVSMSLHLAAYAGSELVIHRRFRPEAVLQAFGEHRVTLMSAAPTIFYDLLAQGGLGEADTSSLRACFSGAAPLPREVLARFETLASCPIYEGYGMSEAGPCLTYNPMHRERRPGTVGLPVPGGELEVVDTDDPTIRKAVDQPGELRVRGPHVMAGYRNLPEKTALTLRDGWLYTGDVASVDADGYVRIHGRKHETINVGGFKVYPAEVEQALRSFDGVGEAAAFGVADARLGQVVHAWVTPTAARLLDLSQLRAHCASQLAAYKVPRNIGVAEALPRTTIGKLARDALQPVPIDIAADASAALASPVR